MKQITFYIVLLLFIAFCNIARADSELDFTLPEPIQQSALTEFKADLMTIDIVKKDIYFEYHYATADGSAKSHGFELSIIDDTEFDQVIAATINLEAVSNIIAGKLEG